MRQPPSPLGPLTPHTLPLSRCWCCRSCLFIMQKAISSGRHCGQRHQAGQSHHLQVGSNNHGVCPGRAASAGNSTSAGKPHRAWYAAACRGHMGGLAARGSQHGARPTASQPASLLAALTCHILHSMGWGRLVGKAIRAYRSAAACRPALRACQRCPPARPPPSPGIAETDHHRSSSRSRTRSRPGMHRSSWSRPTGSLGKCSLLPPQSEDWHPAGGRRHRRQRGRGCYVALCTPSAPCAGA